MSSVDATGPYGPQYFDRNISYVGPADFPMADVIIGGPSPQCTIGQMEPPGPVVIGLNTASQWGPTGSGQVSVMGQTGYGGDWHSFGDFPTRGRMAFEDCPTGYRPCLRDFDNFWRTEPRRPGTSTLATVTLATVGSETMMWSAYIASSPTSRRRDGRRRHSGGTACFRVSSGSCPGT